MVVAIHFDNDVYIHVDINGKSMGLHNMLRALASALIIYRSVMEH